MRTGEPILARAAKSFQNHYFSLRKAYFSERGASGERPARGESLWKFFPLQEYGSGENKRGTETRTFSKFSRSKSMDEETICDDQSRAARQSPGNPAALTRPGAGGRFRDVKSDVFCDFLCKLVDDNLCWMGLVDSPRGAAGRIGFFGRFSRHTNLYG